MLFHIKPPNFQLTSAANPLFPSAVDFNSALFQSLFCTYLRRLLRMLNALVELFSILRCGKEVNLVMQYSEFAMIVMESTEGLHVNKLNP